MIFDVVKQSLKSSSVLIPIERLIGNATGSRMPDVLSSLLTTGIAERDVAVCPTSALAIKQTDGQMLFELDYGECIGCERCFAQSDGALVPADKLHCCGASRHHLVRRWDLQSGKEI